SVPLPELGGQKGAQVNVGAQCGGEPREILGRKAVEKDADAFRARSDRGFAGERRHIFVVSRPQLLGNDKACCDEIDDDGPRRRFVVRSKPMAMSDDRSGERAGFRTRAIHAGGRPDPTTGARAVPIYQTTSYVFESADEAADLFALRTFGNIYSRISNPTCAAFEERMASLEGGLGAVATASGQAAEFLTFAALAAAGDHIVSSAYLYGGTRTLLEVTLGRFGVETTFVATHDADSFAAALRPNTKA